MKHIKSLDQSTDCACTVCVVGMLHIFERDQALRGGPIG